MRSATETGVFDFHLEKPVTVPVVGDLSSQSAHSSAAALLCGGCSRAQDEVHDLFSMSLQAWVAKGNPS